MIGLRARALLAFCGLAVAGCGSGDGPRADVTAYVEQANAVQQRAAPAVRRANAIYAEQAAGKLAPRRQLRGLRAAAAAVERARAELDGLQPPAEARRMHGLLLDVVDLDAALTHQTVRLASYAQRAPGVLRPLGPAGRRLGRRLTSERSPARQAAAISSYVEALSRMLRGLDELDVPTVLRPTHDDQVRRLRAIRSLARRLRTAAADADAQRLARLLLRFGKLDGTSQLEERKLVARGIASYATQLRRLQGAQGRLAREQSRLNREVEA